MKYNMVLTLEQWLTLMQDGLDYFNNFRFHNGNLTKKQKQKLDNLHGLFDNVRKID